MEKKKFKGHQLFLMILCTIIISINYTLGVVLPFENRPFSGIIYLIFSAAVWWYFWKFLKVDESKIK